MRAPLSIVIPMLNAASELPGTLACLIEGLEGGLVRELIVSDAGSIDATRAIAEGVGAAIVAGPAGRGGQLLRGAELATGDWLLFLHADTHLSPGWSGVAQDHMRLSHKAGFFRLRFRAAGLAPGFVAGWANLRSRLGLPYGDQGLLISRALYDSVGGFPDLPLMEDVAMARALRGNLVGLRAEARTGAGRYLRDGWWRRGARNLWTLSRYLAGADPAGLSDRYNR